jgi:hypothetical protein
MQGPGRSSPGPCIAAFIAFDFRNPNTKTLLDPVLYPYGTK